MSILETFELDLLTLQLLAGGLLAVLLGAVVSLNIWILCRIRAVHARQRFIFQRFGQLCDSRDLATVAAAAVLLTRQGQEAQEQDIEAHVDSLLQHWTHIEDVADDVSRKVDNVLSASGQN